MPDQQHGPRPDLTALEEALPEPVKHVAEAVHVTAEQAAHKAEEVTAATRAAAAQATVPVRLAQRRSRVFLWIALGALAGFAGLVTLIHGRHQNAVDLHITRFVQRQQERHVSITMLMHWISLPGFVPWSWLVPAGGAGSLRWLSFHLESIFVLSTALASALVAVLKIIIARPRPTDPSIVVEAQLKDYSFPSGHTIQYVAQFGYAGYLAFALLRPGRLRRAIVAACSALIVLIGPSRIAMGHHWASDVLASYCLGTSFLIGHIALYRRLKAHQRPVNRRTSMTVPADETEHRHRLLA